MILLKNRDMLDNYDPVKIHNQKNISLDYILCYEIIPSKYNYAKLYRCTTKIIEKKPHRRKRCQQNISL